MPSTMHRSRDCGNWCRPFSYCCPSKTVADMEAPKNGLVIYGLHVALPDDMRNFPPDLVPLP